MLKISSHKLELEFRKKEPFFSSRFFLALFCALVLHTLFFLTFRVIVHPPQKTSLPLRPLHLVVNLSSLKTPSLQNHLPKLTFTPKSLTLPEVPLPSASLEAPPPCQATVNNTPLPYTPLGPPLLPPAASPFYLIGAQVTLKGAPLKPLKGPTYPALFLLRGTFTKEGALTSYEILENYANKITPSAIEEAVQCVSFTPPFPKTFYLVVELPHD